MAPRVSVGPLRHIVRVLLVERSPEPAFSLPLKQEEIFPLTFLTAEATVFDQMREARREGASPPLVFLPKGCPEKP